MSYYGEQLKERMERDRYLVKKNERGLGDTISIKRASIEDVTQTGQDNLRQIELIAEYFKLEVSPYQPSGEALPELIDLILHPTGIMKRSVLLSGPWWKDSDAPLLVTRREETDQVLALFPDTFEGYYYRDSESGQKIRITKKDQDLFAEQAFCFYRPLPAKPLSGKEFLSFIFSTIRTGDLIMNLIVSLLMAFIGTFPTYVTQIAFTQIVPSRKSAMLISLLIMLITTALCSYLMSSSRLSFKMRIQSRLDLVLENSVYARIINLPASFFKTASSGALAQKVSSLNTIPKIIGDILMMLTNILMSFVSILPIFFISSELIPPAVVCLLAALLLVFVSMIQETRLFFREITSAEENSGLVYGFISGIERLRVSGSEQRAYARWLQAYAKKTGATFAVRFPLCVRSELITTVSLLGFDTLDYPDEMERQRILEHIEENQMRIGSIWGFRSGVSEWERALQADLNVVCSASALRLAERMEKDRGIPFVLLDDLLEKTGGLGIVASGLRIPKDMERILIIGEQITSSALRKHIRSCCREAEGREPEIVSAGFFLEHKKLMEGKDVKLKSEEDLITLLSRNHFDLVIGDPMFRLLTDHDQNFFMRIHPPVSGGFADQFMSS